MSKKGLASQDFSNIELIQGQAFMNWLINTKKLANNMMQIVQFMDVEELQKEFFLVFRYLIGQNKADLNYILAGKYNYSESKFNELLHYVASNEVSKSPDINLKIYNSILLSCSIAERSFDEQGLNDQRPVELAMNRNNIPTTDEEYRFYKV